MKCKVCGTEQQETSKFCTYCGAPLEDRENTEVEVPKRDAHEEGSFSSDGEKRASGTWTEVHDEPNRTHRAGGGFVGWMRKMSHYAEKLVAWSKGYGGIYLALGIAVLVQILQSWTTSLAGIALGFGGLGILKGLIIAFVAYVIERAIVKYCLRSVRGNDEVEDLNLHIAWEFTVSGIVGWVLGSLFRGILISTILSLLAAATVATTFMSYALPEGEEMKFFGKHITVRLIIAVIVIVIFGLIIASCARGMINALPPDLLQELPH